MPLLFFCVVSLSFLLLSLLLLLPLFASCCCCYCGCCQCCSVFCLCCSVLVLFYAYVHALVVAVTAVAVAVIVVVLFVPLVLCRCCPFVLSPDLLSLPVSVICHCTWCRCCCFVLSPYSPPLHVAFTVTASVTWYLLLVYLLPVTCLSPSSVTVTCYLLSLLSFLPSLYSLLLPVASPLACILCLHSRWTCFSVLCHGLCWLCFFASVVCFGRSACSSFWACDCACGLVHVAHLSIIIIFFFHTYYNILVVIFLYVLRVTVRYPLLLLRLFCSFLPVSPGFVPCYFSGSYRAWESYIFTFIDLKIINSCISQYCYIFTSLSGPPSPVCSPLCVLLCVCWFG